MVENATGHLLTAAECENDIQPYTGGDPAGLIHGFLNYDTLVPAADAAVTRMYNDFHELVHGAATLGQ
ncbi:hypothetical protein AB0G83_05560 [Streptomyces klenkii]|nr:hypothetical protein [Streptomyces klenkii]